MSHRICSLVASIFCCNLSLAFLVTTGSWLYEPSALSVSSQKVLFKMWGESEPPGPSSRWTRIISKIICDSSVRQTSLTYWATRQNWHEEPPACQQLRKRRRPSPRPEPRWASRPDGKARSQSTPPFNTWVTLLPSWRWAQSSRRCLSPHPDSASRPDGPATSPGGSWYTKLR